MGTHYHRLMEIWNNHDSKNLCINREQLVSSIMIAFAEYLYELKIPDAEIKAVLEETR